MSIIALNILCDEISVFAEITDEQEIKITRKSFLELDGLQFKLIQRLMREFNYDLIIQK